MKQHKRKIVWQSLITGVRGEGRGLFWLDESFITALNIRWQGDIHHWLEFDFVFSKYVSIAALAVILVSLTILLS